MSLYNLMLFFQPGRNHRGGHFNAHEDLLNATYRNLSLMSDTELISLRDGALEFVKIVEGEHQARGVDDERPSGGVA
jgi:hypothetical protein